MSGLSELALGVRLAVGGGRQALGRLLLMSAGVSVGVALLIGGLGIAPALQARHARELARQPVWSDSLDKPTDFLRWSLGFDRIGEREVLVYSVRAVGNAPVPPGLPRVPDTGEMFVSPGLADVLQTPLGRIAAERLAATTAGLVGPEGLAYPQEALAYVGAPRSAFGTDDPPVIGFGPTISRPAEPIPFDAKLLIITGVAGLLVPTLVFVATSTRLSAASRERRLAAIRLVGATPAQARLLAAVESGVGAAIGSVLGLALFFVLRPLVASLSLAGFQWFPADIAPPVWQAVLVLVAAPMLAVGASTFGLRRLILSPLGVTRRARVRRTGLRRAVPLGLGLAGLAACWAMRTTVNRGGAGSLAMLGISFVFLLVGIVAVAPWVGSIAAGLLTRGERGLGWLMGARRLQADPTASGRVVGGMALLVFSAGVVHAFIIPTTLPGGDLGLLLRPGAVRIEGGIPDTAAFDRRLRRTEGVTATVPMVMASHHRGAGSTLSVLIADCVDLRAALSVRFPDCSPDAAYASAHGLTRLNGIRPGSTVPFRTEGPGPNARLQVRIPTTVRTAGTDTRLWQLGTDLIFPRSAVVKGSFRHVFTYRGLAVTDGQATTLERVRNAVASLGVKGSVETFQQARDGATRTARQIASLLDLGVLVAMGIALANLLVVSIDHVQERRRPVAALAAMGVPVRILRRSVAVEIGLPVVAGIGLAMALALVVSVVFRGIVREPMRLPVLQLAALAGVTAATVAIVTVLTLPSLSRATRPETLRFE